MIKLSTPSGLSIKHTIRFYKHLNPSDSRTTKASQRIKRLPILQCMISIIAKIELDNNSSPSGLCINAFPVLETFESFGFRKQGRLQRIKRLSILQCMISVNRKVNSTPSELCIKHTIRFYKYLNPSDSPKEVHSRTVPHPFTQTICNLRNNNIR